MSIPYNVGVLKSRSRDSSRGCCSSPRGHRSAHACLPPARCQDAARGRQRNTTAISTAAHTSRSLPPRARGAAHGARPAACPRQKRTARGWQPFTFLSSNRYFLQQRECFRIDFLAKDTRSFCAHGSRRRGGRCHARLRRLLGRGRRAIMPLPAGSLRVGVLGRRPRPPPAATSRAPVGSRGRRAGCGWVGRRCRQVAAVLDERRVRHRGRDECRRRMVRPARAA